MAIVALDGLVGLRVRTPDGGSVGRIAGLVAEQRDEAWVIVAVQVNAYGFAGRLLRWMLNAFTPNRWRRSDENSVRTYAWESIDWSDIRCPCLRNE